MELTDILTAIAEYADKTTWVMLTGGEPGLQANQELVDSLHEAEWQVAIETNGSIDLPHGIDWVIVSPKVAEHCVKQLIANEVKYVRGYGQVLPKTRVSAAHKFISPAFVGDVVEEKTLQWCKELVKGTDWRLSVQQHKAKRIR